MESLETRDLLSITVAEFAEIRSEYADLNLSENLADYNVIDFTAAQLTEANMRSALNQAATSDQTDLIVFRTSSTQNTIALTGGELGIDIDALTKGGVVLVSLGSDQLTLDADGNSRVFNIENSTVALGGITITGGSATDDFGGGILAAGADLTITQSKVTANAADYGGGIHVTDTDLKITRSEISENSAVEGGGIGFAVKGMEDKTLDISGTAISDNFVYAEMTTYVVGGGIDVYQVGSATDGVGNFIVTISDSTVSGNTASGGEETFGGGLSFQGSSDFLDNIVELTNVTITENTAGNEGGGLYLWFADAIVTNCDISDNIAEGWDGGGIWAFNSGLSIIDSTISGNSTAGSGGGILAVDSDLTVTDTVISGNTAAYGAGISFSVKGEEDRTLTISGSTISGNTASNIGGGMDVYREGNYMGGPEITPGNFHISISDTLIFENKAFGDPMEAEAGGLSIAGGTEGASTVELNNVSIYDNSATHAAGGLYFDFVDATFTDCQIYGNDTGGDAGGAYFWNSNVVMTDTYVVENHADDSGGGIMIYGGSLELVRCDVSENTFNAVDRQYESFGGGIAASGYESYVDMDQTVYIPVSIAITDSTIRDNYSGNGNLECYGGGIYVFDMEASGSILTIVNSEVSGNSATYGGGISVTNVDTSISGSTISGNAAFYNGQADWTDETYPRGGGIEFTTQGDLADDLSVTMNIVNSVVSGNYAGDGGGICIAAADGVVTILNSTIAGNEAELAGGIFSTDTAKLVIANSIVAMNKTTDAYPDLAVQRTEAELRYSYIGSVYSPQPLVNTEGCIFGPNDDASTDPGFVSIDISADWDFDNWKTWNLALQETAVAVDAGSNDLLPTGMLTDILGNVRVSGGIVDMGAYEYQQVSVPDMPASASATLVSGNKTRISWEAVEGAESYQILGYNVVGKYWWVIANVDGNTTSYDADPYTTNVTTISVHAVNEAGRSAGKTTSIFRAPTGVSVVAASGKTQISWNAVAGAEMYEILGYNAVGKYWWKIGETTDAFFDAQRYTANVTMVAVHAIRGTDRTIGAAAEVFRSPAEVAAVSTSGPNTEITWSAVKGATSYDIMGYNAVEKYWWKIGETADTSFKAPGYTANVTTISIHAKRGEERAEGTTCSIFRAPQSVSAVASATQTQISWSAVAGATSYDIMGYNKAGNYWWKIGTATGTSYTAPAYTANVTMISIHAIRGTARTAGAATSIVR